MKELNALKPNTTQEMARLFDEIIATKQRIHSTVKGANKEKDNSQHSKEV